MTFHSWPGNVYPRQLAATLAVLSVHRLLALLHTSLAVVWLGSPGVLPLISSATTVLVDVLLVVCSESNKSNLKDDVTKELRLHLSWPRTTSLEAPRDGR